MNYRVLLSAFACDPVYGSDEEVGWQWAKQLSSRGIDVTVITRCSHQTAIEEHIAKTGDCASVNFVYIDIDSLHAVLKRINRRNHLYYYVWQWYAYKAVKSLHAVMPFDLIHHVTWVSFRQPSFMGLVGAPLYFGPVAGGDEIPAGYSSSFSFGQKVVEIIRGMANAIVRYDPLMRMTYRHAEKIFFTSAAHLARVPVDVLNKSHIELAIGMSENPVAEVQTAAPALRQGTQLLFVGRCIGWKGMDLGLRVFAKAHQERPDLTLTIVGDGVDRARWMAAAERLGIASAVTWRGWLPKQDVLALYEEFDLLFYPSLRDSGGFVVLEALQCGLPVVCFKLGGPGVVVDDICGAAVQAQSDISETIECYARAVLATLERVRTDASLADACRERVNAFTWDALIKRIYSPMLGKVAGTE
jgi:glycosyltransferase involved in cell wall biosynthesis